MKFSNGLRILNYFISVFMTYWQTAQYTIEFRYVWLGTQNRPLSLYLSG